jgi:hypothetical protein
VNLPRVLFGGVGVGDELGARSLILIPNALLLTTFRGFFLRGGVAAALRLPARVLEDPAPGLVDESSTDSALRVRAEIGFVSILKLGLVEKKLSSTCNYT